MWSLLSFVTGNHAVKTMLSSWKTQGRYNRIWQKLLFKDETPCFLELKIKYSSYKNIKLLVCDWNCSKKFTKVNYNEKVEKEFRKKAHVHVCTNTVIVYIAIYVWR